MSHFDYYLALTMSIESSHYVVFTTHFSIVSKQEVLELLFIRTKLGNLVIVDPNLKTKSLRD